jgi:prevent-host-death family protein
MITETSAVNFRQNLGEMLNLVQYRNDSILIKKDGKPVAALIDAKLFLRIRQMQERFDALCDRLAATYDGVPEDVAMAEIEQATAQARRETAAAWRADGRLPAPPASAALLATPTAAPKKAKAAKAPARAKVSTKASTQR